MNNSRRLNWEAFLVRLWRETLNGAWHGQIVHLASQESAYFITLAQAETFISRFADGLASQADSQCEEESNDETNISGDILGGAGTGS